MNIEHQELYIRDLEKVVSILDYHNIQYWLDAGTLLGAYRDGNLLCEHDIDLGFFGEDFDIVTVMGSEFEKIGEWQFKTADPSYHGVVFSNPPIYRHIDFIHWYPVEDYRTCWGVRLQFSVPKHFLESFTKIKFNSISDMSFSVPQNTEEYLEWYYGKNEWKNILTSKEYEQYQSDVLGGMVQPYTINEKRERITQFWEQVVRGVTEEHKVIRRKV